MAAKTLTHSKEETLEEAMNSMSFIRVGNKIKYFGVNGNAFEMSDEPPLTAAYSMPDLSRLPGSSNTLQVSYNGESETDETSSHLSSTSSLVGATAAASSSSTSTPCTSMPCTPTTPMAVGLPLKLPRPPAAHLPPPLPSRPPAGSLPPPSATQTLPHSSSQTPSSSPFSPSAFKFPPDQNDDTTKTKTPLSSNLSEDDNTTPTHPIVSSPTFYRSSGTLTVSVCRDLSPRPGSLSSPASPPTPPTPTPSNTSSALVQLRNPSANLIRTAAGVASVASSSPSVARSRANQRQEDRRRTAPAGAAYDGGERKRPTTPDSGIDCQLDVKGHEVGSPKNGPEARKQSLEVSENRRSIIPPELGKLGQGTLTVADLVTGALISYRNRPKQARSDRTKPPPCPANPPKSSQVEGERAQDSKIPQSKQNGEQFTEGPPRSKPSRDEEQRTSSEKIESDSRRQPEENTNNVSRNGTRKHEDKKPTPVPAPVPGPIPNRMSEDRKTSQAREIPSSKQPRESRSILKKRPVRPRYEKGPRCTQCGRAFGLRCSRHHCRRCWKSFCEKCLPIQRYNPMDPEGDSSVLSRICSACDIENAYENCRGRTRGLWSEYEMLRKEARDEKGLDVTSKVEKSDQQQTIHDLTMLLRKVCVTFLVELQQQLERSKTKTKLWESTSGKNNKSHKVKVKEGTKECTACKRHLRYLTESRDCAVCGLQFCTFCTARTLQLYLPRGTSLTNDIGVDMIRFYIKTEEHTEVRDTEASETYFTCLDCENAADRFLKILEFNQKIPTLEADMFDLQRQIDHALSYSPYPMAVMQRSVSTTNLSARSNDHKAIIQDSNIKLAHRLYDRYLRAYGQLEQMQPQTGIQKTLHKHIKQAMYNFYLLRRDQLQTTFRRRGSLIQVAEFSQ